jgi:hypothetical protein
VVDRGEMSKPRFITYVTIEIHPSVAWARLAALVESARRRRSGSGPEPILEDPGEG